MHINGIIGASLRELHTSETTLQDACVCLQPTCGHMPKILIGFKFCTRAKVQKLKVSLCNSTPMDLLNATVDHAGQTRAGCSYTDGTVPSNHPQ